MPARRAPLAREVRLDLLDPSRGLVLQAAHQQPPPGPQDSPVEPRLGTERSGPGSPAFGSPSASCSRSSGLRPLSRRTGAQCPCWPSPPSLSAGRPREPAARRWRRRTRPRRFDPRFARASLRSSRRMRRRSHVGQAGNVQHLPGGQGRGYDHPPVDADHLAVTRCRDRIRDGCEGDVPAPGPVHGDSVGLHPLLAPGGTSGTAPTRSWAPRPGQRAGTPAARPTAARAAPRSGTPHPGRPCATRPPRRVRRVEEGLQRPIKVAQRLLLHRVGTRGQPWVFGAGGGELAALLQVARGARAARVPVLVLLDGQVPDVPGVAAVVPQHRFLGWLWGAYGTGTYEHTIDYRRHFRGGEPALCWMTRWTRT